MPSKVKSKKKKLKRSVTTLCWGQNDDGTLSLTIGTKKPNLIDQTDNSPNSSNSTLDETTAADSDPDKIESIIAKCAPVIEEPALPIKILKSNWTQNGIDYRIQNQTKRRDEMTAQ